MNIIANHWEGRKEDVGRLTYPPGGQVDSGGQRRRAAETAERPRQEGLLDELPLVASETRVVVSHAERQRHPKDRARLPTLLLSNPIGEFICFKLPRIERIGCTWRARFSRFFSGTFHWRSDGGRVRLTSCATDSQFFLVGQKTRQQCCGTTSPTSAPTPSGSILRQAAVALGNDRLCSSRFSCFRWSSLTSRRVSPILMYSFSCTGRNLSVYTSACKPQWHHFLACNFQIN